MVHQKVDHPRASGTEGVHSHLGVVRAQEMVAVAGGPVDGAGFGPLKNRVEEQSALEVGVGAVAVESWVEAAASTEVDQDAPSSEVEV